MPTTNYDPYYKGGKPKPLDDILGPTPTPTPTPNTPAPNTPTPTPDISFSGKGNIPSPIPAPAVLPVNPNPLPGPLPGPDVTPDNPIPLPYSDDPDVVPHPPPPPVPDDDVIRDTDPVPDDTDPIDDILEEENPWLNPFMEGYEATKAIALANLEEGQDLMARKFAHKGGYFGGTHSIAQGKMAAETQRFIDEILAHTQLGATKMEYEDWKRARGEFWNILNLVPSFLGSESFQNIIGQEDKGWIADVIGTGADIVIPD